MSAKNSQRRSKATAPATSSDASAAPPAPPAPPAVPVAAPPAPPTTEQQVLLTKIGFPATTEAPSLRGSKRKAGALDENKPRKSKGEEKKSGKKTKESKPDPEVSESKASLERKSKKAKTSDSSFKASSSKASSTKVPEQASAPLSGGEAFVEPNSNPVEPNGNAVVEAVESNGNPNVMRYLRSLLKSSYPEYTISKEAILEVQRLVYQFGLHFLVTVKHHLESARKNTLMMFDMPICLQRVLSASDLYTDFSEAMVAALNRYDASYPKDTGAAKDVAEVVAAVDEKRKQMWAARAGLSIPPTRIKEFAKLYLNKFRFSQNSITGLTALLERLAILVFQISYEKAQELSRKRISQADVQAAVKGCNNLQWLTVTPVLPIV